MEVPPNHSWPQAKACSRASLEGSQALDARSIPLTHSNIKPDSLDISKLLLLDQWCAECIVNRRLTLRYAQFQAHRLLRHLSCMDLRAYPTRGGVGGESGDAQLRGQYH
jgi:hypothetical protein